MSVRSEAVVDMLDVSGKPKSATENTEQKVFGWVCRMNADDIASDLWDKVSGDDERAELMIDLT